MDGSALPSAASGKSPHFSPKDLAILWRIPFSKEVDPDKVEFALRERIKELNCLYGISQLAERNLHSIDRLLQELVNFLPYSWQFPEITCTRILFNGKTYTSDNFKVTNWRQSSQIYMYHEPVGEVGVFYLEECPPSDEGPFMKEERALLDAIAEQIGTIATRISAEMELEETNRQLTVEHKALQESNTAMRVVLSRIEQEKQEIRQDISINVEKILKPILHAMVLQLNPVQKKYAEVLESNLDQIASPFISRLSSSFGSLTPTEVSICNLIRAGMRTKEIASLRGISEATISRHREKIRHKLKLTNTEANLATYLQSGMWEAKQ
jgi:DNA-binding NarL/FixJ family response regulator